MRDFYKVSPGELSMSMRAFQKLLKRRESFCGAKILGASQFVFLKRRDGKEVRILGMMPMTTSGVATSLAVDKLATVELLRDMGVKHPETVVATEDAIEELLRKHPKIVVKPIDGAHGNGISTDIQNLAEAKKALELARKYSRNKLILAQEQLESESLEVRAIVVGGEFVCAFNRIPAQVTGDGIHTVRELIRLENETIRAEVYTSDLSYIDEDYSDEYLRQTGIGENVPAAGKKVQVVKMCNIGRGGTVEDITEVFPENLKREAEKIAKYFELPVAGIDYLDDYVIEVNSNPSLYYPAKSRAEIGVEKLLDYLETI